MPVIEGWDLSGKSAIITADRRGWTPTLAAALAEAGADVAVAGSTDSDASAARAAVEERGRRAVAVSADLTAAADVEAALERAVSAFGGVDILVNNARVDFGKPFSDVTEAEWDAVLDFNLKSMFLCCRTVGRHMLERGGGRIVNISSGLAVRGLRSSVAVCASQGGVHQLTSALALEWARSGIRVNAIGAGWLTTDPSTQGDQAELLVRYLPSRRKGHPSDLAGLLVYLSSDACDFVTGQTFFIDGGALAHA